MVCFVQRLMLMETLLRILERFLDSLALGYRCQVDPAGVGARQGGIRPAGLTGQVEPLELRRQVVAAPCQFTLALLLPNHDLAQQGLTLLDLSGTLPSSVGRPPGATLGRLATERGQFLLDPLEPNSQAGLCGGMISKA